MYLFRRLGAIALLSMVALSAGASVAKADSGTPVPGANDITWNQLGATPTSDVRITDVSRTRALASCYLNVGNVYMRTSGSVYPFGSMGVKPKTTCTTTVASLRHSVTIYKAVWWGLQYLGSWSNQNFNQISLTTTTPEVVCDSDAQTNFYANVVLDVTFLSGNANSGSQWSNASLPCGTWP